MFPFMTISTHPPAMHLCRACLAPF